MTKGVGCVKASYLADKENLWATVGDEHPTCSSSSPRKRGPSRLKRLKPEVLGEVPPAEVVPLDQLHLPPAEPFLDALLAHDGVLRPDEAFD